jgi:hypothetical protein
MIGVRVVTKEQGGQNKGSSQWRAGHIDCHKNLTTFFGKLTSVDLFFGERPTWRPFFTHFLQFSAPRSNVQWPSALPPVFTPFKNFPIRQSPPLPSSLSLQPPPGFNPPGGQMCNQQGGSAPIAGGSNPPDPPATRTLVSVSTGTLICVSSFKRLHGLFAPFELSRSNHSL